MPPRSVVAPLVIDYLTPVETQAASEKVEFGFAEWSGSTKRWSGEGQRRSRSTTNSHQTDSTFLNDHIGLRLAPGLQPCMARTEGRVTGERQLSTWAENSDGIVRGRVACRNDERCLRQIRPVRKFLHLSGAEPFSIENYSHRIALC